MIKFIVKHIIRPKWVAFSYDDRVGIDDVELGLSVFGVIVALYKGCTIYPDNPINVREPYKREFGESLFQRVKYDK